MIDWVSIVRHSRTRISNYVSPKRRSEQPHGRFMAYSDPPHMPFQPKSKANRLKQQEQQQQQQQQEQLCKQQQQQQQQQQQLQEEEEKVVPSILAESPSPNRFTGTRVTVV